MFFFVHSARGVGMNELGASQFFDRGRVLVVGRISTSSEEIIDRVLEGSTDLRTTDTLQTQQLVQRPIDWVMNFSERSEKAIAFVSIGFGPGPNSDFEKQLWKGEFVEAGDGYEYHHIVEQGTASLNDVPVGTMDSTETRPTLKSIPPRITMQKPFSY
jgi:hypothetical protein